METDYKCPKCGSGVHALKSASCFCDKDFCMGQRCGANDIVDKYRCRNTDCSHEGTTPEAEAYYRAKMKE